MPDEILDPALECTHEEGTDCPTCNPQPEPVPVFEGPYPDPVFKLGDKVWRLNWVPHPDRVDIDGQTLGWLFGIVTGHRMFGRHLAYCLDDDAMNWYFEEELAFSKEERLQRLA